jgi:hypothetical protein
MPKNLKWFTVTSWALLVSALGAFGSVYMFAAKIPMSALVLFGSVGAAFASVLILIVGLAVTHSTIRDSWRASAVVTLIAATISSITLAGFILYAFLHLPVH